MSSYLVIARKWRPSVFEEIIGQEHVTRTLQNAIASGRVAQAYLFSGPRGVGKTTAARILAKCLNCTGETGVLPCNECASCRAITAGSSVDVLEIDGASNTGVENVRDLRENIMYMPAGGGRKIYIVDEVHMLSISAFNALLKTLEEPPPHVVFIFATTEVRKIPLTILSRCQRFEFRRIPVSKMEAHLKKILDTEKIAYEEEALYTIAREADGSLRDAESLLDQVLAFGGENLRLDDVTGALGLMDRAVLLELMSAIIAKDHASALKIIEKIYNFGYDLKRACAELLSIVRDMTALRASGETSLVEAPSHELDALGKMAGGLSLEDLHMLFLLLQKGYEGLARSAFTRHSFEMTVLRASSFDSLRSLDEIVKGLKALGTAARGSSGRSISGRGPAGRSAGPQGAGSAAEATAPYRGAEGRGGRLPWQSGKTPAKAPLEDAPSGAPYEKGPPPEEKGLGDASSSGARSGAGQGEGGLRAAESARPGDEPPMPEPPPMAEARAMEHGAEYMPASESGQRAAAHGVPLKEEAAGRPGGSATDVEGLLAYLREHDTGAVYALLRGSELEIKDGTVEIRTDPKALTFLMMKRTRMEELFSAGLGRPVKVALGSGETAGGEKKDPVDLIRRVLGARVLEDSYVEGG